MTGPEITMIEEYRTALQEIGRLKEENTKYREALEQIGVEVYILDFFPTFTQEDMTILTNILRNNGLSLDGFEAHIARKVRKADRMIAQEALGIKS